MNDDLTARIRKILRELRSDEIDENQMIQITVGLNGEMEKTEDVETKQSLPDV